MENNDWTSCSLLIPENKIYPFIIYRQGCGHGDVNKSKGLAVYCGIPPF